jgi:hypothetical protein
MRAKLSVCIHTFVSVHVRLCSQTTQEGIDLFLSQRLDSTWDQDKRALPLQTTPADLEGTRAVETASNQEELARESGLGLGATGWQGREAELALEVRVRCCGRSLARWARGGEACLTCLTCPPVPLDDQDPHNMNMYPGTVPPHD